jgi:hypothetical protein
MVEMSMKMYARIQDGLVAELLRTDGDITTMFHPAIVWIDVSSEPGVSDGWRFDGKTFTPPPPSPSTAALPTIADLQARLVAIGAQLEALTKSG